MKLSELLFNGEFTSNVKGEDIEIKSIETDQNKIEKDTLFVFIRSINFDVTNIISYVISKRPVAIICDYELDIESSKIPVFKVKNTRRMLSFLYSRFYKIDYTKSKFIGITGTNGKTTTATLIAKILEDADKRVGLIGTGKIEINGVNIASKNYSMTTPDPPVLYKVIKEMQDEGCEFIVMEVTSHALFFEKTAPIPYDIAVFNNLSEEHLDFHKDMEEYYKAKLKLFESARCGIFNMDDIYSRRAKEDFWGYKTSIGIVYEADNKAREIKINGLLGSEYVFSAKNFIFKAKTSLPGTYNVYNTMMAISVCTELGIRPCNVKKSLEKINFIDGRFEVINDGITVIIDYAHTPDAYENLLKTIKSAQNLRQKLICVFGCGGNRDKAKRPKIAEIAERYSDVAIITTDNSRGEPETKIIEDILKGFKSPEKRKVISSRKSAIEHAILLASQDDTVAIIGKGHEKYYIDNNGYHDFDERRIIKDALKKRKKVLSEKR